jgi:ABC-type phosphate transport system substrate-binding protein
MKKAKIFILVIALFMTLTAAACGNTTTPVGTEPPPSSSPSQAPAAPQTPVVQTQDTSSTYNLSDGYNIEVIQTEERSGEIRLTDPHLRPSYPATSDSIPADDDLMYMWRLN